MPADLRPQHIIGNVLVIAPRDENHLFREAPQPRDGPAGGGSDGIIVEPDPVLYPHQLDPVLHTAEILCHLPHRLVGGDALHRRQGCHIVFNVVHPGQENVPGVQHRLAPAQDGVPGQPDAVCLLLPGKEPGVSVSLEGGGKRVVCVENQDAVLTLETVNILLGGNVLRHVLMDVQMVGRQVRDHRPLGRTGHVHKLKGAQLRHGVVILPHPAAPGQQGLPDIAPQPDGFTGGLQHLGNQGGCSGLTVGAGDRDGVAGADLEEHLHLRGDLRTPVPEGPDGGIVRVHARGPEHHIGLHPVQVSVPHPEGTAGFFQRQDLRIQLLPGGPVTAGHIAAEFQQQPHQRPVADPQPQHRDPLSPEGRKIAFKCIHKIDSYCQLSTEHDKCACRRTTENRQIRI